MYYHGRDAHTCCQWTCVDKGCRSTPRLDLIHPLSFLSVPSRSPFCPRRSGGPPAAPSSIESGGDRGRSLYSVENYPDMDRDDGSRRFRYPSFGPICPACIDIGGDVRRGTVVQRDTDRRAAVGRLRARRRGYRSAVEPSGRGVHRNGSRGRPRHSDSECGLLPGRSAGEDARGQSSRSARVGR